MSQPIVNGSILRLSTTRDEHGVIFNQQRSKNLTQHSPLTDKSVNCKYFG